MNVYKLLIEKQIELGIRSIILVKEFIYLFNFLLK